MLRRERNPRCAINVAVEVLGDQWSLLVLRDIALGGKHEFGEFLASEEGITTSVLADRLATLVDQRILCKRRSTVDRRRERYELTEKGLALIPVLVELATWGSRYGPLVPRQAAISPGALDVRLPDPVVAGGEDSGLQRLEQFAAEAGVDPSNGACVTRADTRPGPNRRPPIGPPARSGA